MNYLREINEFQGWAMRNRLSTGEIALWYALMSANNEVGWSDEFAASSLLLQLMTGLSRQGIERARSQLIAKMRVEYRKGTGKSAGVYSMKSFECQKVGTRVGTTVAENEVPSGHNSGVSVGTKIFPSMSDLSTKQNKTKTKDPTAAADAPVNDESPVIHQDQAMFNMVRSAIERATGRLTTEFQVSSLLAYVIDDKLSADLVIRAIEQSALGGKDMRYAASTLKSWREKGIVTLAAADQEAEEYRRGLEMRKRGVGPHGRDSPRAIRDGSESTSGSRVEIGEWQPPVYGVP